MEKSTTTAGFSRRQSSKRLGNKSERASSDTCLTAGIAALAGMMEGDAAQGDRLHRGADACPG